MLPESTERWLYDPLLRPEFEAWVLDGCVGLDYLPRAAFSISIFLKSLCCCIFRLWPLSLRLEPDFVGAVPFAVLFKTGEMIL